MKTNEPSTCHPPICFLINLKNNNNNNNNSSNKNNNNNKAPQPHICRIF